MFALCWTSGVQQRTAGGHVDGDTAPVAVPDGSY